MVIFGQDEVKVFVVGEVVKIVGGDVHIGIIGLGLGVGESCAEVPAYIELPALAFAEAVGSQEVDVVAAVEMRFLYHAPVVAFYPS